MNFLTCCVDTTRSPFSLLGSIRTATKRAGGTVHNHGGSPGKRLGIKKFSDQAVIPGNIIVRQRGTLFHPGQHVKIGRDHTIYATAPGFVRFYKEKWMRGTRRFVGVVLERGDILPRDEAGSGRSRYFGLVNLSENLQKPVAAHAN
ncbi:hypothetical protein P691DRAFT_801427 [Macrolepiota fuliginosa MF-IS2]|uniref:Large ribosomal subunit protein bL27m n=1 Tax=Macrolepiota fuliginosa MF-IS2 TaxID=1400762 RepID=A0A9P5XDB3_9AGAR|nr:hypothetical protein P691DRAFT_801427 [Macrolepiota fuliginosa MF-IS2]